ncbi:enolase C-terminal domain-like protein [Spiribacter halobius]|uniref:Mandelate racemase n=1 Tax=Sediminicurvatus halobius TaxID=2182432 RepID=A0A2U2N3Y0_9GAMM|nr:enolase C-terminal domain-like protein [Spiribacter halobius]PWG63886.1 mandelate racemase [Spiribacter halobius]UEX76296.1 mandelate racemase [Spiribacter halobius]
MTAELTIRDLQVRGASVPMPRPLVTGGGTIRTAPLALVDLLTEEGVTGHTYLFCYTPPALGPVVALLHSLAPVLQGQPLAPHELERSLRARFRLLGSTGIVGMAIAGIDMAAWDALARSRSLPLVRLLGGQPGRIPAYNSCGLGMIGPERAGEEARELVAAGFPAVKIRLGYPELATDLAVVRAVREAVGEGVRLMCDYNQSLSVPEAECRVAALAGEGLTWIEEPTLADDLRGYARIRAAAATPIQAGENWWGAREMQAALDAGYCDLGMPDVMKIGGITGWLRAAAVADTAGLPLSSHIFPEVSAHLLAASPTRHWLEYVDWANPILREPLAIEDGHALVPDRPGSGIEWDEAALAPYLCGAPDCVDGSVKG